MIGKFIQTSMEYLFIFLNQFEKKIISLFIVFTFLILLVIRLTGVFSFQPDTWGIMENSIIYSIQNMLNGAPLYPDPELPPFSITQYSPLYYYMVFGTCKLLSIKADHISEIYTVSRFLSLLGNFLWASSIFALIKTFYKSNGQKIIYPILLGMVGFIILQRHAYSRPDSFLNAAILFTIFFFIKYIQNDEQTAKKRSFYLIVTALLSATSILLKQSAIVLPVLICFFLIIILRNFKSLLIYLVAFFIFITALLLPLYGDSIINFYKNTVLGLNNGLSLSWFWYKILQDFFCTINGLIFTCLIFLLSKYLFVSEKKEEVFLGYSIIALFLFALLTSLKIGSTPSYFTEVSGLCLVGFSLYTHKISIKPPITIVATALFLCSFASNPKILVPINKKERFAKSVLKKEEEVYRYVSTNFPLQQGEWIFINKNGWESYLSNLFFKNGLFPHKDIISQKQVFPYTAFDSLFQSNKIPIVITDTGSLKYLQVDFSAYKTAKEINGYKILVR